MLELHQVYAERSGEIQYLPLPDDTLLLYPSGDSVVISDSINLSLKRVLAFWDVFPVTRRLNTSVKCLAVDPGMKLVLASMGPHVAGWSLSRVRSSDEWRVHSSLTVPHDVTGLESRSGLLVVGTEVELVVFTLVLENDLPTWSQKWTIPFCSPSIIRMSPSLMFIAISCSADDSVGIHLTSSGRQTQKIRHSRPIVDITWRAPEATGRDDVVLYTVTSDSTLRVFLPLLDSPQRLQLHASLDLFSTLPFDTASSYLSGALSSRPASKVFPLDRKLIHDSLFGLMNHNPELDDAARMKIKEVQREGWDLFLRVLSDGSLVLTAIANIDRRPPTLLKQFTLLQSSSLLPPMFTIQSQLTLLPKPTTAANGSLTLVMTHPLASYDLDLLSLFAGRSSGLVACSISDEMPKGLRSDITRLGRTPDGRGLAVMRADGSETWSVLQHQTTRLIPSGRRSDEVHLVVLESGGVYVTCASSGLLSLHGGWPEPITLSTPALNTLFSLRRGDGLWSLIGIAEDLTIIHVRVDLKPSPSMTLHSHTSLPLQQPPMMILPVDPMAWSGAGEGTLETEGPALHDVLLSVSADGQLSFWVTEDPPKSSTGWKCTGTVTTNRSSIRMARCSSAKKTALVVSGPTGEELTIWDSKESEFASGLEYRTILNPSEVVNDLDWTSTPDKQSILAVGYPHCVELLCQQRMTYFDDGPGWAVCWRIETGSMIPHPINDSIWLANGSLAIGAGHMLCLYSQTTLSTASASNREGLFEHVARHNGPLEDYHPQMLLQCLLWGKVELVKDIIVRLAKTVNEYHNNLGAQYLKWERLPPEPYFKKDEITHSAPVKGKPQYNLLFNGSDAKHDHSDDDEFSRDAVQRLLSQIEDKPLPHMTPNELAHLTSLIQTTLEIEEQRRALDANGLRYLISMRSFYILNRRATSSSIQSPSGVGTTAQKNRRARLRYRDIIWAFHSESQEILLSASMFACDGKMNWSDAKALGVFMWLHSLDSLKLHMEVVARNQYMSGDARDPTACSLFYFALGKSKLVHGLWRQAAWHKEQSAMLKFLSYDFTQARWRTAALKNAYALMGKQRFEYAAAFFLLGGSLKDAVNVCTRQIGDFQLAVAIARIVEQSDDGPVLKDILTNTVVPIAFKEGNRWLGSWAFWLLNRRDLAVRILVTPLTELASSLHVTVVDIGDAHYDDPSLALLFSQLRSKTLQTAKGTSEISGRTEFNFVLQTARVFARMGCHMLALDLVRSWSFERPSAPPQDKLASMNGPPSPSMTRRSLFALSPAMRRQSSVFIDMEIPTEPPTRAASPTPSEIKPIPLTEAAETAETIKPESDLFARKAGLGSLMKSAKEQVKVPEFDMGSFGF